MSEPELEPPDGMDVSLEALSQSFARLFGSDLPEQPSEPIAEDDSVVVSLPIPAVAAEASYEITPRNLVEAMLFVGSPGNQPLTADEAAAVMRGVEPEHVHDLVRELNEQYAASRCPYEIASEGAGYRLVLRSQFKALQDQFHGRLRQARLSQAAIDVLAIVAYNQPLTSEEVARLRNAASNAVLSQLVRRRLLRLERDEEHPRRPRYFTTDRFLDLFGLASLEDLPQGQDLE